MKEPSELKAEILQKFLDFQKENKDDRHDFRNSVTAWLMNQDNKIDEMKEKISRTENMFILSIVLVVISLIFSCLLIAVSFLRV